MVKPRYIAGKAAAAEEEEEEEEEETVHMYWVYLLFSDWNH